ncbi:SET-binding protein [Neoarius graeffei]|uniref:SET-binding protein n=1 Tax=Neoarius graeffei TaxID=443677 RepID=UPI00298C4CE7|nr:SET-binding protein [Neoarius graeffei]XP_060762979.1 SET-binding protein [Neoarius graeffei]XP_060762980.1 SET-binding protein [Neoarius graeffei]
MEQRDLTRLSGPKGNEEFFSTVTTINRADLTEVGLLATPVKGLGLSGEQQEHEEDEDLGLGKDMDATSNADSEKWVQGDSLEEQEFSIKEASFSEGSLKLKIQTTKRAKKPPKSLENYICPPEIRVTIKQPGEPKTSKHGKSTKGGKEEDRGPPRKRTYERPFRVVAQNDNSMMDVLGENLRPKHEPKTDIQQLDWTKPILRESASQGDQVRDPESKQESTTFNNKSLLSEVNTPFSKAQVKKVTEGSSGSLFASEMTCPGSDSQATSPADTTMSAESNMLMHSSLSKERGLQEVTEQVFGNIKRKYGRRTLTTQNGDLPWAKKIDKEGEKTAQDNIKNKLFNPEKTETLREEVEKSMKRPEGDFKTIPTCVPHHTDEPKIKKKKRRRLTDDNSFLEDIQTTQTLEVKDKADQGATKPKVANKMELSTGKQFGLDSQMLGEESNAAGPTAEISENRHKKKQVGGSQSLIDPEKQADGWQSKLKGRWVYLKSKGSAPHKDLNPALPIEEPPSAFPITPSSPLYTNTNSLTVITPMKKKRGRPKKQPLLTVETIHEGTSTSPVSPINQDSPSTSKRRRKKHNLSKIMQQALHNSSTLPEVKCKRTGQVGVLKKKTTKKVKLVKMQSILNELLSSSNTSNLALKSSVPVSSAVSTVASTIEARLGKQINVSKRGTIYIGKKRGRKPKAELQTQQDEHKANDEHLLPVSSQFENLLVPSNSSSTTRMPSPRVMQSLSAQSLAGGLAHHATIETSQHDLKTMPNLQPISALPTKTQKGLLSSSWKLSPPRLLANSPSHLSEVASIKEVTLSPVSESHSEETIPSDSGIGTDNNSTSDQTEKGPASRRRYSFDLCGFEAAEAAVLEATNKTTRGHYQKHATSVAMENFLAQESLKKQKHRRKRKGLTSRDDLQFLADLEELISKFQIFRISHRSYKFYHENSYPSIFRLNFDHYYPMPYYPYDPVHYLRRSSEKSKRRRGRPAKSSEPITKMPFIQGFGYSAASGNYYAPYAMPYTAMPLATSMMNMGYYGQYPPPLYLSHALGSSGTHLMRPPVPPPKFHSSGLSSLSAGSRHRMKNMPHEMSSPRMGDTHHPSSSCLASVCLHKRKHKHKHKHKEDQHSVPQRENLGGLFSGALPLSKIKDTQRSQQSMDTSSKTSRNYFEVDTLSSLSLSDSQNCKHPREEPLNNFLNMCTKQPHERLRANQDQPLDPFKGQHLQDEGSHIRSRRHSLEEFAAYSEGGMAPFQNDTEERMKQMYHCGNTAIAELGSYKKRCKRNEIEEMQSDVRKKHTFSKILTSKRSLDHVNKILKVKRLQRQAKTGNNVVKRRRGRPRKQTLASSEGFLPQMPVLEKCMDFPGKRNLHSNPMLTQPEFSSHDSITDAIESVVHQARAQPNPQTPQMAKPYPKYQPEEQLERPVRRGRGSRRDEPASH